MTSVWDFPDFDDHEGVHLFTDPASGCSAVIAVHSTTLGPAAGGARFWHYADSDRAITDALRLSRGMSYKNAMAGLAAGRRQGRRPRGEARRRRSPTAQLEAFGRAVESLGGRYVTAEDVGMSEARMKVIADQTRYVSGLPVASGAAGGDPGPYTAHGVYLGVKAAAKRGLGATDMKGVHVAIQGVGSVGGGLAQAAGEGRREADAGRRRCRRAPRRWPANSAPTAVAADAILTPRPTSSAPTRSARS